MTGTSASGSGSAKSCRYGIDFPDIKLHALPILCSSKNLKNI